MSDKIDKKILLSIYKNLKLARRVDEKTIELLNNGEIYGWLHPAIGMEAIGVGIATAMQDKDFFCPARRTGISGQITRGMEIDYMMAEMMGRIDGFCHGKGGATHFSAGLEKNIFTTDSVVGSRPGYGAGIALSFKLRGEKRVVAAGYGDGAANQGLIHEVMNMAAIWKLPILFYCENNQYAVTTSAKYSTAIKQLSDRASAYGFSGETVDGMDVITVYKKAKNAIENIRSGDGPYLLECISYRFMGHYSGESFQTHVKYRTDEEINYWKSKDPLRIFPDDLIKKYNCTRNELGKIDREVEQAIEHAVGFARKSKFPEPEDALKDMYATPYKTIPRKGWID